MNTVKVYRVRNGVLVTERIHCSQTSGDKLWRAGQRRRTRPYPHEAKAWAIAHGWALSPHEARLEAL